MEEFTVDLILIAFGAITLGGTVKGTVGIGLPLFALPILANYIPVPKAIGLLIIPSLVTSIWQSLEGGSLVATVRRFFGLLLFIPLGVYIGVRALMFLAPQAIYLVLGILVLLVSFQLLTSFRFNVKPELENFISPLVGLLAGLVAGISMLVGPVLALYFVALQLPRQVFITAISLAGWYSIIVLAVMLSANALISTEDVLLSLGALVPSFLGLVLGQWFRRLINEKTFMRVLAVVLFFMALNLLGKV